MNSKPSIGRLELISPPVQTSKVSLLLVGVRPPGTTLSVGTSSGLKINVTYESNIDFTISVSLQEGENTITVSITDPGIDQSISHTVVLVPLEVSPVKVINNLDEIGIIANLERLEDEGNVSYRRWIGLANDLYDRDGTARGLTHSAIVGARVFKRKCARVVGTSPFTIVVKTGSIEIRCEDFVRTRKLGSSVLPNRIGEVIETVLTGQEHVRFESDGSVTPINPREPITYRYALRRYKDCTLKQLSGLLGSGCRNSSTSTSGELVCLAGKNPDGPWPDRFFKQPEGCANASCQSYSPIDLGLEIEDGFLDSQCLGIIPGLYRSTWNGEEFFADLGYSPLFVMFLAEREVQEILLGGSIPGAPSKLESLRSEINRVMPYVYDCVLAQSVVFADDIGVNLAGSIRPRFDVPIPSQVATSGSRLKNPILVSDDGAIRLQHSGGIVNLGEESYYLFRDKATKSLLELAVGRVDLSSSKFLSATGRLNSTRGVSLLGDNHNPQHLVIESVVVEEIEVSPVCCKIDGRHLTISFSSILSQRPDLSRLIDDETVVYVTLKWDSSSETIGILLRQMDMEFFLESEDYNAVVVITDDGLDTEPDPETLQFYKLPEYRITAQ